ncbi:hypothetical protein HDF11_004518 [Tunturiibacter psychrotolerans]
MSKLMNVEELIASQLESVNTATVEAIDDKPAFVRVTPWTRSSGCLCHLALDIRKSLVAGVSPTGDTHVCCGKTLKVVELHFKQGETIAINDVFGQLHKSAIAAASSQGFAQPQYAPGRGPDYRPPFNCLALSRCLDSPSCGGNIFCQDCDFYRLACTPWASVPAMPFWHGGW